MYPQNNYYYPANQTPNVPVYQPSYGAAPPTGLKGRPVSSYEEARAMTIDFDGSTFFFPDLANKRIYTKQINMDGTASLFVYELRDKPMEQPTVVVGDFITREEFEKVIKELRAAAVPAQTTPPPVATAPAATAKVEQPKPVFNLF
jgi:hypothetical protein